MSRLTSLWGREPAMILAVVQAAMALVATFGLGLTVEQTGAVLALTAAVLGLLTRSQVTPLASPRLGD